MLILPHQTLVFFFHKLLSSDENSAKFCLYKEGHAENWLRSLLLFVHTLSWEKFERKLLAILEDHHLIDTLDTQHLEKQDLEPTSILDKQDTYLIGHALQLGDINYNEKSGEASLTIWHGFSRISDVIKKIRKCIAKMLPTFLSSLCKGCLHCLEGLITAVKCSIVNLFGDNKHKTLSSNFGYFISLCS